MVTYYATGQVTHYKSCHCFDNLLVIICSEQIMSEYSQLLATSDMGLKPCTDVASNLLAIDLRLNIRKAYDGSQQKFQQTQYFTSNPLISQSLISSKTYAQSSAMSKSQENTHLHATSVRGLRHSQQRFQIY